ncbi:MAG TPA: phosphatidylserine decarboxylase [Syntrophales bacterium]|nr:phosphatidylserine decarboxylase [Syntrophobacterales bacterium]HQL91544.1 phosphatidylserine decarboxylase [Syntrophales bacterium]
MITTHQYIERETNRVETERLYWDGVIRFLYGTLRESAPALFRAVTGTRMSAILGFLNYDLFLGGRLTGSGGFLRSCGIDLRECLDPPATLDTPRKIFERKIRYWECRPMPGDPLAVVSPADSKVLLGSFSECSGLCVKGKFFDYEELLGPSKGEWIAAFRDGDFLICRLTPEKYHYNHTPVAGIVADHYEIDGACHSCNPGAVIALVTPYSKNKRVVTVIDTDVPGGTQAGLVAMIEVAALMIGGINQCYSEERYHHAVRIRPGMFLRKGCPKSLYLPGSSTDIVLFQRDRVEFCDDLVRNSRSRRAESRFTRAFGLALAETDVKVRSAVGRAVKTGPRPPGRVIP